MTPDGLITDRYVMRSSAPDILLTNYKMLDQMLLREADAKIWAAERAVAAVPRPRRVPHLRRRPGHRRRHAAAASRAGAQGPRHDASDGEPTDRSAASPRSRRPRPSATATRRRCSTSPRPSSASRSTPTRSSPSRGSASTSGSAGGATAARELTPATGRDLAERGRARRSTRSGRTPTRACWPTPCWRRRSRTTSPSCSAAAATAATCCRRTR